MGTLAVLSITVFSQQSDGQLQKQHNTQTQVINDNNKTQMKQAQSNKQKYT